MLRWLTAGESHGEALTGIIEGLPAHVPITRDDIRASLARRRLGYGRGARMKFEADEVRLLGGVRHGRTLGSPVAIEVEIGRASCREREERAGGGGRVVG